MLARRKRQTKRTALLLDGGCSRRHDSCLSLLGQHFVLVHRANIDGVVGVAGETREKDTEAVRAAGNERLKNDW